MPYKKIISKTTKIFNPNSLKSAAYQHKKNLLFAAGSALVALILLGIFVINQKSNQNKYSAMLHESMIEQQMGDLQKAKSILKKIHESSSAPTGIKSMASIRYAAFLLEESNKSEALKIYLGLNKCSSCDDFIRDLAGLLAVRTLTTDEEQLSKPENIELIQKIENKATILKFHIAEQRALIELLKGNLEKSYQIFEMIAKSPEVKQGLKSRASDGMQMLIDKGYSPNNEIKQIQPEPQSGVEK